MFYYQTSNTVDVLTFTQVSLHIMFQIIALFSHFQPFIPYSSFSNN